MRVALVSDVFPPLRSSGAELGFELGHAPLLRIDGRQLLRRRVAGADFQPRQPFVHALPRGRRNLDYLDAGIDAAR